MAVQQFFRRTLDILEGGPLRRAAGGRVLQGTLPIGAAGAGGLVRSAVGGVKTLWQRATGNPLAAGGVKGFIGRIAGRALGYGTAVEAFQYQKARAAGTKFDPIPNIGSVVAFAANPLAALGGTIFGTGQRAEAKLESAAQGFLNPKINVDVQGFQQPDYAEIIQALQNYQTPSLGSYGGSIQASYGAPSVNIQAGGGIGGTDFLFALLGGVLGGLGGYAAGTRRRRKKYKRRKRK